MVCPEAGGADGCMPDGGAGAVVEGGFAGGAVVGAGAPVSAGVLVFVGPGAIGDVVDLADDFAAGSDGVVAGSRSLSATAAAAGARLGDAELGCPVVVGIGVVVDDGAEVGARGCVVVDLGVGTGGAVVLVGTVPVVGTRAGAVVGDDCTVVAGGVTVVVAVGGAAVDALGGVMVDVVGGVVIAARAEGNPCAGWA